MIRGGRRARRRARRGHGPRARRRALEGAPGSGVAAPAPFAGGSAVTGLAEELFTDSTDSTAVDTRGATRRQPTVAALAAGEGWSITSPFTSSCSFERAPDLPGASRERFVMTLNAPPPRPLEPEAFHDLVDAAARYRRGAAGPAALDAGLDLQGLCRFAAGALAAGERRQVEAQLATTPWATTRVAALLRGARGAEDGALARGVLEAARAGEVDAARVVGAALAREGGGADEDPRARAGAALGAGRYEEARAALAQVQSPSPLVKLAERVAQLERDPDMALCELLQTI